MSVELVNMSRELFHELFRGFEYDSSVFADMELFEKVRNTPYSREAVDAHFDRRLSRPNTLSFAVMLNGSVIGEVVFKNVDMNEGHCELGIHLINDSVKGKGFGTEAEKLAIEYAFSRLGMSTVLADTIIKNERSRHILEKLGFKKVCEKDNFFYYKLERNSYYGDCTDR